MQTFQYAFADVNGIRMHYVRAGRGKLILFVHGFPEFWYQWRHQLAEFGRDFLAVAPDLRGYNLSSKPRDVEQYRMPHLVEDLWQLARYLVPNLRDEKFYLVAHDWGGVVAWAYAMYHPQDLEKLIIINSPHPAIFARELRENPAQRRASRYMKLFCSRWAELVLSAFGYRYLVRAVLNEGLEQGHLTAEDKAAYLQAWSQPGALTGGLNYYRASRADALVRGAEVGDFLPRLASLTVKVPTLLIWGERDRFLLPGNLDGLEQFVPRLTVHRVPDASHWIVQEKPELVSRYIREFIQ